MKTFNSLYASLKLQVFFRLLCGLAKCCTYVVKVNIAPSLNRPFSMSMQTLKSLYASSKLQMFFLLICGLTKCCTYAVPVNIAHLLNRPFLFPQTFTSLSYFIWGGASFFETFLLTFKSLYFSLKLQVFFLLICGLANCCIYTVPVNIPQKLNKPLLLAMQTFNSLYASLELQVFFLRICGLANCCTYAVQVNIAH